MTEHKEISLIQKGDSMKLIPSTFEEAQRIVKAIGTSAFVPKGFLDNQGKPKEADMVVAILWGAELGMSAIKSLQSIDMIPGRSPSLKVEAMKAIVLGHVDCQYMYDQEAKEGDELVGMQTIIKRRGHPEYVSTFTIDQAKKAGLWGKSGPWTQYPRRMLAARSAGFAIRDKFADILAGITCSSEEVADTLPAEENKPLTAPEYIAKHILTEADALADLLEDKVPEIESDAFEEEENND